MEIGMKRLIIVTVIACLIATLTGSAFILGLEIGDSLDNELVKRLGERAMRGCQELDEEIAACRVDVEKYEQFFQDNSSLFEWTK